MNEWIAFALVFGCAFAGAFALAPLAARLGHATQAVDHPGGRRHHLGAIPRLGGIALFGGFILAALLAQILPGVPHQDPQEGTRLLGLLLGSVFLFVVGLIDDRHELAAGPQFAAQAVAALIAIAFQIFIEYVSNPLPVWLWPEKTFVWPYAFTLVLTFFWLTGMINTVNWLDGVDGLAAGVTAIAAIMMFINSAFRLVPAQTSVALLPLALAGACLGFLPYNFYPARIFMGSSGALFLGFALGALSIIGGAKVATILLVMGMPILDVAWQVVRRMRAGRNPGVGDRGHLHFRLVDLGVPPRAITLGYYAFCALFGTLTLVFDSALYKLIALVGLGAIVVSVMFMVWRAGQQAEG